jgi:hypothetical protein
MLNANSAESLNTQIIEVVEFYFLLSVIMSIVASSLARSLNVMCVVCSGGRF